MHILEQSDFRGKYSFLSLRPLRLNLLVAGRPLRCCRELQPLLGFATSVRPMPFVVKKLKNGFGDCNLSSFIYNKRLIF